MSRVLQNFTKNHSHVVISMLIGLVISFLIPSINWNLITRFLVAWNIGAWIYLIFIMCLIINKKDNQIKKIAEYEDEKQINIVIIMVLAVFISIAAIVMEINHAKQSTSHLKFFNYLLILSTIFASWLILGVIFTFHYAHLFYSNRQNQIMTFPDDIQHPNYWDFLYFSFTICVAAQTSDICIKSTNLRKIVLFHSIISFFFNVAVIGLSINIAAGLIN